MFLDPEDYDAEAEELVDKFIRISSDKQAECVIGYDDGSGVAEVVAALFTGYNKETFSFDVAVHKDHRRKGLARTLVRVAIDQFEQLKDAYDKDFHMEIDIVNPDMERLLKSMGFEVEKRLGRDHVTMVMSSAINQAVHEMTSSAKVLKKTYRRNQAFQARSQVVAKTGVPSFEEVWEFLKGSDGISHMIEGLSDDSGHKSQFEYETDKDPEEHSEEYQKWLLEGPIKKEVEDRYDDVVFFIDEEMDGEDCWRAVGIPKSVDPVKHPDLGIYWSSTEEGADEYWGKGKPTLPCVYRARIDRRNVDIPGTVYARMDMDIGEMESEVRMIPGAKIFVYDVEVQGDRRMSSKAEVIEINDWRHA